MSTEVSVTFECESEDLLGILHLPGRQALDIGILIVVGGPQYRVGSHRQFVLMARGFAAAGYPTLRFDYRGMGDSSGAARNFEHVDADLRAAIDVLLAKQPQLRGVVIAGLCDAASAALMYCERDERLTGLILMNPWVRTETGAAQAVVRHYYGQRLLQRSFWSKVLKGHFNPFAAAWGFAKSIGAAFLSRKGSGDSARQHFVARMLAGWRRFKAPSLLLLSDRDLTAREFEDLCASAADWRKCIAGQKVAVEKITAADHTFSSRASLEGALDRALRWLATLHRAAVHGPN